MKWTSGTHAAITARTMEPRYHHQPPHANELVRRFRLPQPFVLRAKVQGEARRGAACFTLTSSPVTVAVRRPSLTVGSNFNGLRRSRRTLAVLLRVCFPRVSP